MPTYLLLEDGSRITLEDDSGFLLLEVQDPPTPTVETPTGGWNQHTLRNLGRQQSKDDIRREREKLGIVPRQAKKIEKLGDRLADEITAQEPNAIVVEIMANREFQKLLQAFAQRDAERRAQIAEFAAQMILMAVIAQRDAEEEAIVTLIMEM
jgi:hypothetical protein